jgi:hypothetical protein
LKAMRHLTIAALTAAILAAVLVPASASAQRQPPICKRNPDAPVCKRFERLNEKRERARDRTVTPACRAAGTAYSNALRKQAAAKQKQASAKKALKNAKGKKAKAKKAKALGKAKKKTKKANKAVAAALKARAKACSSASTATVAQRGCRPAGSPRCERADKFQEKRQEISDRQKGITPACRSAADKYSAEVQAGVQIKRGVDSLKTAVKNAKTKKAKKKLKKQLKKMKKRYKASTAKALKLKAGYDTACAGARVKPF